MNMTLRIRIIQTAPLALLLQTKSKNTSSSFRTESPGQLFVKYADAYENKEKLKDILIDLISHDKYGCRQELQKILMLYQDAA